MRRGNKFRVNCCGQTCWFPICFRFSFIRGSITDARLGIRNVDHLAFSHRLIGDYKNVTEWKWHFVNLRAACWPPTSAYVVACIRAQEFYLAVGMFIKVLQYDASHTRSTCAMIRCGNDADVLHHSVAWQQQH